MKSFVKKIWEFFAALGEARYATFLARNGKWKEAKKVYQE